MSRSPLTFGGASGSGLSIMPAQTTPAGYRVAPTVPAAPPIDFQAIWRAGGAALTGGAPQVALGHFHRLIEAGQEAPGIWVAVALAHRALGDAAAKRGALEKALALDPRHLAALVMMGDHFFDAGDGRAATSYYGAAVRIADVEGAPPEMAPDLNHARERLERYQDAFTDHLHARLDARGLERPGARRVRSALDLLVGRRALYLQQPTAFYFPELPNVEYAERADFPWMDRVESATADVQRELEAVMNDPAFRPYTEAEPDRPFFDTNSLRDNPDWTAFYLIKNGAVVPENAERCPATMAAIAEAPLCRIPGRTPSVFFSRLQPGTEIPPHHGFMNARYICHLPLIVPDGCAMRVGSDTRPWREGRACLFDDSIEHEAWNKSQKVRVVLIFDIWRPELSETERDLVSAALEAVDAYEGGPATA